MNWFKKELSKGKPLPEQLTQGRHELPTQPISGAAKRTIVSPQPNLCAITDVGRERDHNEDLFYVAPDCSWFVVADGLGGHEAGEVAAALAVKAIEEHLTAERRATAATQGNIASLLLDAVNYAHTLVQEENRKREDGKEMGCTLVLGCVIGGLVTCHVGDSRCYVLHDGVLQQITSDHSTVGALVAAGELTEEEARVHPKKNEVLQALGTSGGIFPDVNNTHLSPGNRILLCTDGLWEALPHTDLQAIVASDGTMRQLATQLVDRANDAGGFDNITAVLFEVLPFMPPKVHCGSEQRIPEQGETEQ